MADISGTYAVGTGCHSHRPRGQAFIHAAFAAPDPGAVYLENAASALYLERPADVAWYAETFRFVQAAALGPKETRDMLVAAADHLELRA